MVTCSKGYADVPFAHRQPKHDGHCAFIHGHNWDFEFEFAATEPDQNGFVVDFGKLDPLRRFVGGFDHALVIQSNDPHRRAFRKLEEAGLCRLHIVDNASCEGLARHAQKAADKIVRHLTDGRARCIRVTVYEDRKNSATYRHLALIAQLMEAGQ